MKEKALEIIISAGVAEQFAPVIFSIGVASSIILLSIISNFIAKKYLLKVLAIIIEKSHFKWDDVLLEKNVFQRLAHIAPASVIYLLSPLAFSDISTINNLLRDVTIIYMIFIGVLIADSFLSAMHDIYKETSLSQSFPIKGIVQALKIILYLFGGLFVLSAITSKTPLFFLSGLGALTAVFMLIFKDAILGFVAGIQIAANDMVREGDWIEMPQYGADGDVLDVSLTNVKVQNWDKTISSIPTYDLISKPFKNWRGMSESEGRRIKRALNIDISTVKFCDEEMLERFRKIQYITEYIESKKQEIASWNKQMNVDDTSLINGRKLTNLGTFRAYIVAYLKNHPDIHQDMTFLVRQLAPTSLGLPLEIYVFSKIQAWAKYEDVQADIFDHMIAASREFDIKLYQEPSGADMNPGQFV
jgi:miniconductance mechanosensitive channel